MLSGICVVVFADNKRECGSMRWTDTKHGDNSPSTKQADKEIHNGANVCELAKKCDHMEIKVDIHSKSELHQTSFYKNADAKQQKELDESMEDGHGAKGMKCYELEYAATDDE